jgi:tetratricopeptide (TPR) repeat protein
LSELREDVDKRLRTLEEKLNEATSIPEGKEELWSEADRQLQRKNYKLSRTLWRTFISRYPGDPKLPEANFKVGLTFFSERDYKSALGQFYNIIQTFSEDPIVADALYYSGLGFAKLGQCKNAIGHPLEGQGERAAPQGGQGPDRAAPARQGRDLPRHPRLERRRSGQAGGRQGRHDRRRPRR